MALNNEKSATSLFPLWPPVLSATLLSYMKLLDVPLGLLINFHVDKLTEGVSRLMGEEAR